ncbi:MAG: phosphodiesterase [Clostridia bacterium]|nr:phosphodiesterase [Clostridia bacterium]
MKLIIASDLHGSATACKKLLDAFTASGADRLILLGDLLYHGPRNDLPEGYDPKAVIAMLSEKADKLFCVRGNCDTEVDQMVLPFPIMAETALLFVDGRTWFACHGHRSGANPTANDLPRLPAGSVVLSGHTHIPVLEENPDGVILLNPGSVSIPKGGFPASYGVYEDGHFAVMGFEGERIFEYGEA